LKRESTNRSSHHRAELALRALPESADSVLLIRHNPSLQELALVLASPGTRVLRASHPEVDADVK
jgi:phosphohistidine phosphatase SixA